MADEGFLRRWSRLKGGEQLEHVPAPAAVQPAPLVAQTAGAAPSSVPAALPPPPTLADAAALQPDSDFSLFVARNVDAAVRRLAMKKLFSDPHFHGHDGLDIYMGDYNIASPVPPDMLDQLEHSKSVFRKLDETLAALDGAPESASAAAVPVAREQPAADALTVEPASADDPGLPLESPDQTLPKQEAA